MGDLTVRVPEGRLAALNVPPERAAEEEGHNPIPFPKEVDLDKTDAGMQPFPVAC
jgi:hypothetical protein